MIFDGDCGFCRRWIARWRQTTGNSVEYAPYQEVAAFFPEIPPADFRKSVQLVEPGGARSEGARAIFQSLSYAPHCAWALWCYRHLPLARPLSEALYRLIASHRDAAARATQLLWGEHLEKPEYAIACVIFLRSLGLIFLIAFCSLWLQISGLIGHNGILPLAPYLNAVRQHTGPERYYLLPTLSWLNASDGFTHLLCGCGALVSLALTLGIAPAPCLLALWVLYLSLASDCRDFLGFQWDALLLESAFLAAFLAPLRSWLHAGVGGHSRFFLFLLKWLLFRLMFSSGFVKLASGDETWHHLSALRFHFETQPLPTWIGWYVHQAPDTLKTAMVAAMYFVELVVPFFIFAPRRLRLGAFSLLLLLQVAIAATGNYAFLNLLTVALCLLLLDDRIWPRNWQDRILGDLKSRPAARSGKWPHWILVPCATGVLAITSVVFTGTLGLEAIRPRPLILMSREVAPLRTFNHYGLFAIMTTSRPEIIIEGSNDGESWLPYSFKYKPVNPGGRPAFVAPYQPRLDWQMWFAALGRYEESPWFENLMVRLLQGSPEVLALLAGNPFPNQPPRFIRASYFTYRFTPLSERARNGSWWSRELLGLYYPARFLGRYEEGRREITRREAEPRKPPRP
jgi:predicted DCC family thiol-disulfide oxidoreductase YuxK